MFSRFRKNTNQIEPNVSSTLRIVGDRGSGKTTYLAALARWPILDPQHPVKEVTHTNDAGKRLADKARIILEEGQPFVPTPPASITHPGEGAAGLDTYGLKIVFKEEFSRGKGPIEIDIQCKDYSGELFGDFLLNPSAQTELNDYIEDCTRAGTDILLLIDSTSHRKDRNYEEIVQRFLDELNNANWQGKIAVALSKCEDIQVWGKIHSEPIEGLVNKWFPRLFNKLNSRSSLCQVQYFALSAFGVYGTTYQRPNYKYADETKMSMVLEKKQQWKPYGLVSPLYWLCTGTRYQDKSL